MRIVCIKTPGIYGRHAVGSAGIETGSSRYDQGGYRAMEERKGFWIFSLFAGRYLHRTHRHPNGWTPEDLEYRILAAPRLLGSGVHDRSSVCDRRMGVYRSQCRSYRVVTCGVE